MANNGDSDLASWVDERLGVLATAAADRPVQPDRAWRRFGAARRRHEARRKMGLALAGPAVAAAAVLGGVPIRWWNSEAVRADLKPERDRPWAPDFALTDRSGRTVRLSQFRGRVVLVDFWATWCPPCREEIPWFAEFQRAYDSQGLTVVGVAMDEDGWKSVGPFVERMKADYPMVIGSDEAARRFRVESLPTTLVIDRSGRVAATHVGLVSRRAVESEIRYLLGARP